MNVTRIEIGRLYNLGSYEHVSYKLTVEVKDGESPATAMIGLEKIIAALAPERQACVQTQSELEREENHIKMLEQSLLAMGPDEFRRRQGRFEGTPEEYIERCKLMHAEQVARRSKYETRAKAARELLDNLGGTAIWKDAKLDWENEGFDA